MSKFIYSLLGFLFATQTQSYQVKIVNTAIISFLPELKLHNVVFLQKNKENIKACEESKLKDVYLIDVTPKKQPDFVGYVKMFLGYNIPGIIRFIHLKETTQQTLVDDWVNITEARGCANYEKNRKKLGDKKITEIIDAWPASFNVYTHNCQHFSDYLIKNLEIEKKLNFFQNKNK
jgi:hypothetical protein